jgi:hypothetical protein
MVDPRSSGVKVRAVVVVAILALTVMIVAAILLDVVKTGFLIGPFRFSHWMTWIGSLFVAIYAPLYHYLKRRYPQRFDLLMDIHSFGFLTAFLLISIHFAGQVGRSPLPQLGEGIALFTTMLLLVSTGIIQRFWRPEKKPYILYTPRSNRFLHTGLITAFYVIVGVHAAINLL